MVVEIEQRNRSSVASEKRKPRTTDKFFPGVGLLQKTAQGEDYIGKICTFQ